MSNLNHTAARSRTVARVEVSETAVAAVLVHSDGRVEHVSLVGDDAERFARIRRLIRAAGLDAISIDDHDGPAALAWVDEAAEQRREERNDIVSTLSDRTVLGSAVITGFGHGEQASMTSVHAGLRRVLDRMATENRRRVAH